MTVLKFLLYLVGTVAVAGIAGFAYLGHASRSGSAPGLVEGRLSSCPSSPNCISSEPETQPEKRVDPLPLDSWNSLPAAIAELGGKVTAEKDDYIASEFSSAVFGFVDDVEFRRGQDAVHVRSASRVGYSDGGVNAERIEDLRGALSQ